MRFRTIRAVLPAVALLAGMALGGVPALASPAAAPATFSSPIGPITQDENTFLHTHPVNITAWAQSEAYRAQVLAQPEMAVTAGLENAASPPPVQLSSTLTYWGFFCAGSGASGCLNNWSAQNGIKFGSGSSDSNVNGQFNQWYYGGVTSQWPYANTTFYNNYHGNSVYQYAWAPHGDGSGNCVTSSWGENQGLHLDDCLNSYDEFWIWDGNAHWVNVLWTVHDYEDNPTNPHSWCAGSPTSGVSDGTWIATKMGCSLKWHSVSVG